MLTLRQTPISDQSPSPLWLLTHKSLKINLLKQNIQLQQVQRNQINRLDSSRRKHTTDFTRGQQINVRNPLTGLWMPAVIAEKRQEPMYYDVQIGNRIIRRAHHHIRKAYTPPLHTPLPIPDMSISNHAPITFNTYSMPQCAPPPLPTAPPLPATLSQSAPPPPPTTPPPLPDPNLSHVTGVVVTTLRTNLTKGAKPKPLMGFSTQARHTPSLFPPSHHSRGEEGMLYIYIYILSYYYYTHITITHHIRSDVHHTRA